MLLPLTITYVAGPPRNVGRSKKAQATTAAATENSTRERVTGIRGTPHCHVRRRPRGQTNPIPRGHTAAQATLGHCHVDVLSSGDVGQVIIRQGVCAHE